MGVDFNVIVENIENAVFSKTLRYGRTIRELLERYDIDVEHVNYDGVVDEDGSCIRIPEESIIPALKAAREARDTAHEEYHTAMDAAMKMEMEYSDDDGNRELERAHRAVAVHSSNEATYGAFADMLNVTSILQSLGKKVEMVAW